MVVVGAAVVVVVVGAAVVVVAVPPVPSTATLSTLISPVSLLARRNSIVREPLASETGMSTVRQVPHPPVDGKFSVAEVAPSISNVLVAAATLA